jgi:hypothetical protein
LNTYYLMRRLGGTFVPKNLEIAKTIFEILASENE